MRLRVVILGAVQGVGFRPFVYRLASELKLAGWVRNAGSGVVIEAEGSEPALKDFLIRLESDKPPLAIIQNLEASWLAHHGYRSFEILPSEDGGEKRALILPDIATCPNCLRDIFDLSNRRHRYPFTNCTNCGPRFTIIEALPYDRANTTMKIFPMCPACQAEYDDPADRRFHAQPNACLECGPHVEFWGPDGTVQERGDEALLRAEDFIKRGKIVAVKGMGGFHLMADARSSRAVAVLRERKGREEKPFALMYPGIAAVEAECGVEPEERRLLLSPQAPIVFLKRRGHAAVSPLVAPHNPYLAVMLPYTPLHHLLLSDLGFPLVATSGNLTDEPICTDEHEALRRLAKLADGFLVHNRPIARHADDSIVRLMAGREVVLRRARGYAPLPVTLEEPLPPLLGVGGHLKNTIAFSHGRDVFLSQHMGDLETSLSYEVFRKAAADLPSLYGITFEGAARDLHPDYLSTHFSRELTVPVRAVQHHAAHFFSVLAETQETGPAAGVVWDGTGFGPDGTVWGGEFFHWRDGRLLRAGHLRTFPLPGGEQAVREPRRSALGILYALFGSDAFHLEGVPALGAFTRKELEVLQQMLEKEFHCPRTSSAGRLFDAVASLAGLRQKIRYEGQAAMELEAAFDPKVEAAPYPFRFEERPGGAFDGDGGGVEEAETVFTADWGPMVEAILDDIRRPVRAGVTAARFHRTLAEIIAAGVQYIKESKVVLSGGCFQNRVLLEKTADFLRRDGRTVLVHQRVPPNDGGIALGQVLAAGRLFFKGAK